MLITQANYIEDVLYNITKEIIMFKKVFKIINKKIIHTLSSILKFIKLKTDSLKSGRGKRQYISNKKMNFDNMKLGTKLEASFAVIIILFIIPISVSMLKYNETVKLLKKVNDVTIPEVYYASSVSDNLKIIEKNLYASTLTDNKAKKDDYIKESQSLYSEAVKNLENLKVFLNSDTENVDTILKTLEEEARIRDVVMTSKYKSDASRMIFNSYDPIIIKINSNLDLITEKINAELQENAEESDKASKFTLMLTIAATTTVVLLGWIISKSIAASIAKPIMQIEDFAMSLSEGNLDCEIEYESNNEIGRLAEDLRKSSYSLALYINEIDYAMKQLSEGNLDITTSGNFKGDFKKIGQSIDASVSLLSDTLKGISQLSSEVSLRSSQLLTNSQTISKGAAEQSSSIEESQTAIDEISEYAKANTENTHDARNTLYKIDGEITSCSKSMNEMLDTMSEISKKSSDIEKFIKVIDNITFQTNLLALNAAVEAARAGNAGKGFAVVADEVRSLALNSSEAAKNIASIIDETSQAIHNGNKLANETATSLSKIVTSSNDATIKISEITKASEEQLSAIREIKSGIDHISTIVLANSNAAEQSYADSCELSLRSQKLHNMLGKFTL